MVGSSGKMPQSLCRGQRELEESALYRGCCLLLTFTNIRCMSTHTNAGTRVFHVGCHAPQPHYAQNERCLLSSGVIYFCLQLMLRALGTHHHPLLSGCTLACSWVAYFPPQGLLCFRSTYILGGPFHLQFPWPLSAFLLLLLPRSWEVELWPPLKRSLTLT